MTTKLDMRTKREGFPPGLKHSGLNSGSHPAENRPATIDPLLTMDELCDLLKVEAATIYQLTYRGKIPHYKIANKLRFRASEILSWIEEHRVNKSLGFSLDQGD